MSTRVCLQESEHVQRQHARSGHSAFALVGRCHNILQKLLTNLTRQPSAAAHVACSSLFQPIPIVPSMSRSELLLHQGCDQIERGTACSASTRAHSPDSASASRLLVSTSSPVVSHTETIPPFQILRCLRCFRESVSSVRLRWFLDHRQLSFLVFRLKPQ